MTFIPQWAEKALTKPSSHDLVELVLLGEFYEAWEDLMAIPGDKVYKNKREAAAGVVREKALTIRAIRKGRGG